MKTKSILLSIVLISTFLLSSCGITGPEEEHIIVYDTVEVALDDTVEVIDTLITWNDVLGKTWYNKSQSANVLNTVTFYQDTIYHWIDTYSPVTQTTDKGLTIPRGQVVSRQLRKGSVYHKGDVYRDGDGEYIYCFNVKWKEYVPETGAPVYDWAVYGIWWLWMIDEQGLLHWGDFDANDSIQRGWQFYPEPPIDLDYSWYQ